MLLLLLYSPRKRFRFAAGWGSLNAWLSAHIIPGFAGPVLVLFHTVFKFSGIAAIAFWSMTLVVASGVVGKFIFALIPRSLSGMELNRIEMEAEEIGLTFEMRKLLPAAHPFWLRLAEIEREPDRPSRLEHLHLIFRTRAAAPAIAPAAWARLGAGPPAAKKPDRAGGEAPHDPPQGETHAADVAHPALLAPRAPAVRDHHVPDPARPRLRFRPSGVRMEFLSGYRFILAAITIVLVVAVGVPFIFKEIRKKRRAGELAKRIIPVSSLTAADIESIRSLHPEGKKMFPAVNRAVCVGCGACAQSCREKDVLAVINGKSTLINPLACRGEGDCERNCVTGGLKMVEYGSKLKIRVPWTDENFESNIKGIYVVGSLTGAGLIKEAINQGRIAVNHIMKGAFPPDLPTVLVIGAGPAGLSAMLSCRKFGLPVICFEKDRTANTIRNFPKKKFVMGEPVEMPIVGPLWVGDASRERLLAAWEGILDKAGACIATGSRLEMIEQQGRALPGDRLREDPRLRQGHPRPGQPGRPQEARSPGRGRGERILQPAGSGRILQSTVTVVGAGDSAIEAALALQRNGCRVTLLVRGDGFPKAKARNQERIGQAIAAGQVRVFYNIQPLEIGADAIAFTSGGETRREKTDSVFVMAGGELPFALLEKIGIEIVEVEI